MASNALLTSIVVKSFLCASLFELMPSKTCCVRLLSKVLNVMVKTCVVWVQEGHHGGLFVIRHSVVLDGVQISVMGL